MKPALLFLSHRIPFPPDKGDKIRSFHLLKYLAGRYRIFLGAFVDDPEDWQHRGELERWCAGQRLVALDPRRGRLRSLRGLLQGRALTLPYYYDREMADWVAAVVAEESIQNILVYSSAMAQYVRGGIYSGINRVIDFVDVDSDKWRQYAGSKQWPMSWIYRREAARLLAYEREIAAAFSASLFVSEMEAGLFRRLAPESAERISYYNNGVDVALFDPALPLENPFPEQGPNLVFTGAMDYWPNEDAVTWFVDRVLPGARRIWPGLRFYIVGSQPSEGVRALARNPGVVVTGRVVDVRPYIRHASAVVAPMRIARGIQNKVLEAMAMARPVVVSPMGLEGIDAGDGKELLVAESADEYLDALTRIIDGTLPELGARARQTVVRRYSWDGTLPRIEQWMV